MPSGESRWITNKAARQDVQLLRARSCAIMTGIGTVIADDCELTARFCDSKSALSRTISEVISDIKGATR